MINTQTLARPYARAAFEFAKAANQVDAWFVMLQLAACAMEQPVVVQKLGNPALTRQHKSSVMTDLLVDKIDDAFGNFLHIVGEHERLALLPTIAALYETSKLEAERVVDVEVETAFELDDQQLQTITAALSKRLERTVKAKQTVNTALIGGLTIRAGDLVIDSSVRGRLNKLAEALNS